MAERVQSRIERFSFHAKILKKLKIYDDSSISNMVGERTRLEYGVCKRSPTLEDFKYYIDYELTFLNNLNSRLKRDPTTQQILAPHYRRVQFLFKLALQKFKGEFSLWECHFKFCFDINDFVILESSLSKFLRFNYSNPEAWLKAAKFYYFVDTMGTKKIYEKGLKSCPDSKLLKDAYFEWCLENHHKNIDESLIHLNELFQSFNYEPKYASYYITLLISKYTPIDVLHQIQTTITIPENRNDFLLILYFCFVRHDLNLPLIYVKGIILKNLFLANDFFEQYYRFINQLQYSEEWTKLVITVIEKIDPSIDEKLMCQIINIHEKLGIKMNEDLLKLIFQHPSLSIQLSVHKVHDFGSCKETIRHYKNLFKNFPQGADDIISSLRLELLKYNNKHAYLKILKFIDKNYPLKTYYFIGKMFDWLLERFYNQEIKEMVIKFINRSTLDISLLLKIKDLEFSQKVKDFKLLRQLFEACIEPEKKLDVEYWVAFYQIEKIALAECIPFSSYNIDRVYNNALNHLSGSEFQAFLHHTVTCANL